MHVATAALCPSAILENDLKIVAHIGAGKCGSSSIQSFMRINERALLEQGFLVPRSDLSDTGVLTGHHVGYFEVKRRQGAEEARSGFIRDIETIEATAPEGVHTILLSAENLSNPARWHEMFGEPITDRLRILAYVRRQDDFLESAWQQWYCKTQPNIHTWLKRLGRVGDWRASLRPWFELVGGQAMTVKRYTRDDLLDGDVVKDYANLIGVDIGSLALPEQHNITLNAGFTRLLELSQGAHNGIGDNRLFDLVCELTGERHSKLAEERLLSGVERQALLDRFSESNSWVRDTFFPELAARDEPLFRLDALERQPAPVEAEVAEKRMWSIIVDLLLKMADERRRPVETKSASASPSE